MSKYKGKKVLIVGFGLSGVAVARYLAKQGAKITITDIKQKTELHESLKQVADLKLEFDLGKHTPALFQAAELIVVSPGVPLNLKPLEDARALGIQVTTEVELAASVLKEPLIAVTGTNGKTTVTTLLGEVFKADKKDVYVGGNIGKPLLDYITDNGKGDYVIAELSSYQLELTRRMVPACAVFTNIDQDHLDRYGSMEAYIEAKKRLLNACDRNSYLVLNYDDPVVAQFADEHPGKVLWFTKRNPMQVGGEFAERFTGAYFVPGSTEIVAKINGKEERYDVRKLRIFGDHNKENVMATICASRVMGVAPQAIQTVIDNFEGIAHRLELIRKKGGVYFINDSKATNPHSLHRSLQAFKKNPIILIAGGKDKDFDFSALGDIVQRRCKLLILLGEAKEKMNRAIGDLAETYLVGTFEEAILLAYQKSRAGDIILLSPGCSSLDMFRSYEERGDYYKKLVSQL